MDEFSITTSVRWADLDTNGHVRHSVYYDWGAHCRIRCFDENGLTIHTLQQLNTGPILFREECIFRKEVLLSDKVIIAMQLLKARRDYSRWTIFHTIYKNDKELAATLTVDGAWLDLSKRKLAQPPEMIKDVYSSFPLAKDFVWLD